MKCTGKEWDTCRVEKMLKEVQLQINLEGKKDAKNN